MGEAERPAAHAGAGRIVAAISVIAVIIASISESDRALLRVFGDALVSIHEGRPIDGTGAPRMTATSAYAWDLGEPGAAHPGESGTVRHRNVHSPQRADRPHHRRPMTFGGCCSR